MGLKLDDEETMVSFGRYIALYKHPTTDAIIAVKRDWKRTASSTLEAVLILTRSFLILSGSVLKLAV